ncbi:MAG: cytidylate kinase family protein [Bacteroidales bacterium]|jgi:cytidylate kinase|nr:cytidylate kinase family protein [Bacteroidales bacterium]
MNIIALTGDLGSGKSTVSAILCRNLSYGYIYTGAIQRKIAEKYGMSTTELNKYAETHPEIDEEIDATFRSLNDASNIVADSRLAWFFIPASFKVFLKTNLAISAERIAGDKKRKGENYPSVEEAIQGITERKTSENKRYRELYGAECANMLLFDLIVDTSYITPEHAADIIMEAYAAWQAGNRAKQALISPFNLYPTLPVSKLSFWDTDNQPVQVVHADPFDFVVDGHKRVSNALKTGKALVPALYVSADAPYNKELSYREKMLKSAQPEILQEWETFHGFKFRIYPPEK